MEKGRTGILLTISVANISVVMKTHMYNRGIAPLIIVLVLALAVAVGGGAYYVQKHKISTQSEINASTQTESNTQANSNNEISAGLNAGVTLNSGTIRSLLSIGKDVACTFSGTNSQGTVTGTSYISGTMMRGDFTLESKATGTVNSHMIRNGNDVYVWTGSQGAKMSFSAVTGSDTKAKSGVDLDSTVQYTCKDWTKDTSKFTLPTGVSFLDINAMLQGQANFKLPAHY